jgi:hypothetical protein
MPLRIWFSAGIGFLLFWLWKIDPTRAVVATTILFGALAAYFLALRGVTRHRDRCPACSAQRLALVNAFRANPPPSYSFHRCEACQAEFVKVGRGDFEPRAGSMHQDHMGW